MHLHKLFLGQKVRITMENSEKLQNSFEMGQDVVEYLLELNNQLYDLLESIAHARHGLEGSATIIDGMIANNQKMLDKIVSHHI